MTAHAGLMPHEAFEPGSRAEPWRDLAALCEATLTGPYECSTVVCSYGRRQVVARLAHSEVHLTGAFAKAGLQELTGIPMFDA